MLRQKFFLLVAIGSFACGQTSSGDDGGTDAKGSDGQSSDVQAFDQITTGCVNGSQQSYPYDASACAPQLDTSYSCNGSICSWTAIIPCTTPSDAGADADAGDGGVDCMAICNAVAPQGQPPPGFCQPGAKNDAGTTIICGGCGV